MFNLQQFIANHVTHRSASMFVADIECNRATLQAEIEDKSVCVIGGAGSIGSSFIKAMLRFKPKKMVVVDLNENGLAELVRDVRSTEGLYCPDEFRCYTLNFADPIFECIFREEKGFDIVANFSAHKHVRSEKDRYSVQALIENNDIKAKKLMDLLCVYPPKHFFCVSTDKAANPVNIMGASKRMCEMIIQAKNKTSKTEFAAVRFGNVLGSNGSVLPLFKKQIEMGGPVTVTHKDITRFFMTIPEAVGLVLQAMSYAKGGEIFVLDMGEPVRIYDLAVSLIKLSGLEPDVDIPIKVTGLRPGEKLYEELLMQGEGLKTTAHNKIFIGDIEDITEEQLEEKIAILKEIIQDENIEKEKIRQIMKKIVPTYHEPEEVNTSIKNSRKELGEKTKRKQTKAEVATA